MYFVNKRQLSLLSIESNFAHLRKVNPSGDLEFEFYYKISPSAAIENESVTVKITIFSKSIKQKSLFENSHTGFFDAKKLIDNVLTQVTDAKNTAKQRQVLIVATKNSDVSAKINNETIGQLRAKVPINNIQQLNKRTMKLVPASSLKNSSDIKPVLQYVAHKFITDIDQLHQSSLDENPTKLMYDMITRQGIDPSDITKLTHRSISSVNATKGTLRPSRAPEFENSSATRLLNYHIFPADTHLRPVNSEQVLDSANVHILVNEPEMLVEVPCVLTIPKHALQTVERDNSHFYVKFELINSKNGLAIDTVMKSLDVARHVQMMYTPKKAPIVKVTKSEISTRVNLEIKQVETAASAVQIFKKNIFRASTDVDDYSLVGTYNVKHNEQSLLVQVELPKNSTAIYRVIPVGELGTQGFEFTNVVVKPGRFNTQKAISFTSQLVDTGVKLEIRHIPQNVVSIEFLAKNKTIFESSFHNVGKDITLIDSSARSTDYLTVIDTGVKANNVYEYVAKLIYESGTFDYSGNILVEFVQPESGKVDTKIIDLAVEQLDEINVTFTISTSTVDNNLDIVKTLLKQQDVYDLFKQDVEKERDLLKNLIAHNVQRVDLTTGERVNFGVITTTLFSDKELRKNQAIPAPKLNHKYRYDVFTLLRSPETLFETLIKQRTDQSTKKTYSFNPTKFLHPITLNRGTLVSPQGLKLMYSKDPMMHGVLGSPESIEVSFDNDAAYVVDASAVKFDKFLNVVTWKLKGNVDQIDHFLIMKDVLGVRTLIGKVHSEFQYGNCQYLHRVSDLDEGSFHYVIIPIFNDYKSGMQVITNSVTVEARL